MAIRNTNLGGTNWTEEGLKPTDINDTFDALFNYSDVRFVRLYADNTGGSILNSTTETDLATLTITQNDLGATASLLINAGVYNYAGVSNVTNTLRLYIGGVLKKSIAFTNGTEGTSSGSSFAYLETGIDTTAGNIIVKVTGQSSTAIGGVGPTCTGLTVQGYESER